MISRQRRRFVQASTALLATWGAPMPSAFAQTGNWPRRPVKIIVGLAAGGLTDLMARGLADALTKSLGQPFLVDNRPGAGSIIAAQEVARAQPDGYTVLFTIMAAMVHNRALYAKLPYNPTTDFIPISLINNGPQPMVVNAGVPARNIEEFVAWARKTKVNFGSLQPGATPHMVCNQLNKRYGLDMQVIQYRGEAPMWPDVVSGTLHVAMGSYAAVKALPSASVRTIAVLSPKRVRDMPDVPTFIEQGLTDKLFSVAGYAGMFAPAALPPAIRDRLSDAVVDAWKSERLVKLLDQFGIEGPGHDWKGSQEVLDTVAPPILAILKDLNVKLD